jgi:hypothetical protein
LESAGKLVGWIRAICSSASSGSAGWKSCFKKQTPFSKIGVGTEDCQQVFLLSQGGFAYKAGKSYFQVKPI